MKVQMVCSIVEKQERDIGASLMHGFTMKKNATVRMKSNGKCVWHRKQQIMQSQQPNVANSLQ